MQTTSNVRQVQSVPHGIVRVLDENTTVFVGSEADPGTLEKHILIAHPSLRPIDEHRMYDSTVGWLQPGATDHSILMECAVVLSPGCTITGATLRGYRETSDNDVVQLVVYRIDEDGDETLLAIEAHDGSGWQDVSVILDEDVDPDQHYLVRAQLFAGAVSGGVAANARVTRVRVDYTTPDYAKSI